MNATAEARAQYTRLNERKQLHEGLAGYPMPSRFRPFVDFLHERLMIPKSKAPDVRFVSMRWLRKNVAGFYSPDFNEVKVRGGMDDALTLNTLAHEHCHAYETLNDWKSHSEGFADARAERLVAEWQNR